MTWQQTGVKSGTEASSTGLLPAFDDQDQIFSRAFAVLDSAIAARAFPAASIAVTYHSRLVALKAFGNLTYENPTETRTLQGGVSADVSPATLFDLASVTKVVATTTVAMLLYQRGLLDLDAPVAAVIPEFLADSCAVDGNLDPRRHVVTFQMLLAHCSGLPAYEKLFLEHQTRDDLLRAAFTTPLTTDPGSHAEYSDIGFIVLGAALERMAGESFESFCQREIFGPLGMAATIFNPPEKIRSLIPPTADDRTFRRRIIQGEVQDENASILGGVAGHAGLFSTARDLAGFAHAMLNGGRPILHPETVSRFTRRETAPQETTRTLGWDTPSAASQSGKYFNPGSFGHLGYTGTSLWIDPERQVSITLLTNRTWPDCSNQAIKRVRPEFHDAVVESLGKNL